MSRADSTLGQFILLIIGVDCAFQAKKIAEGLSYFIFGNWFQLMTLLGVRKLGLTGLTRISGYLPRFLSGEKEFMR